MTDQQFRALSSCLVIAFLMVTVTAQKNGPEKGNCIVVTQLIYELKLHGFYLRNRKHVQCFHRVILTRVGVWENEKNAMGDGYWGIPNKIAKYRNIIWFYQLGNSVDNVNWPP